ncbi:TorD/DmsD family molecular chaperone [Burkholderia oklahomensis]|uniref:Nitrate reductase delta subunit n=1 Tax=Burkholderia oklahomensis TaxID=342113 RepID=A0AAI8FQ17_9BURK|nr:molecular chaperone TorD family protein [Burkholderia oklahomensis]AIO68520.1 nitrate reductase delta subunit [Burkholderia oklahomensis]AJX34318.1 nitrate reductase delta subunit [Burkholderia oklahomensis C6786]AOI38851.1 hypothetical protein WG70_03945 [Burkholderia oklahomensis EO147]AOI48550.1 hypothetical protein WI23_22105 [Burkholderia oklahomensis C6786]KUY49108.1 hypothetical protein WI23_27965 [Burkholderia oklahomensis C6786]
MIDEASEFRALVASWIAGLLAAPLDEMTIAHYREPDIAALLDELAAALDCHSAITGMHAALASTDSPRTAALDLSVAYTRLFEGVTGAPAVPLYESAYMGSRLFDQATHDMASLLPRVGMAIRRGSGEPPDHISVELALLASLLRKGDDDNAKRMEARLRRWIPAFVAACRDRDPGGFYGSTATLLGSLFGLLPSDALHGNGEPDAHPVPTRTDYSRT